MYIATIPGNSKNKVSIRHMSGGGGGGGGGDNFP